MEDIVEHTISDEEISRAAVAYDKAKEAGGEAEITARFQYALALLKSAHKNDITKGVTMLEDLYYSGDQSQRRDYLYFIAIGSTRLKHYDMALESINLFLQYEPTNHQATQLRDFINKKLTQDGLLGMAMTGAAVVAVGGLVGLMMKLASSK